MRVTEIVPKKLPRTDFPKNFFLSQATLEHGADALQPGQLLEISPESIGQGVGMVDQIAEPVFLAQHPGDQLIDLAAFLP